MKIFYSYSYGSALLFFEQMCNVQVQGHPPYVHVHYTFMTRQQNKSNSLLLHNFYIFLPLCGHIPLRPILTAKAF